MSNIFLQAEWRDLVVLNFEVPAAALVPYLPTGLELDLWDGKALASLVAFRFLNTRVLGIRIPFHENFEEINLRFYVRRFEGTGIRRGVVFIKEMVPRAAIASVARWLYNENYFSVPMSHSRAEAASAVHLHYCWRVTGHDQSLSAEVFGEPRTLVAGSEAEFIFEHYWGYSRSRSGKTIEYQVQHVPWRVWEAPRVRLAAKLGLTYGDNFAGVLNKPWRSAFVAEGSPITVSAGRMLESR